MINRNWICLIGLLTLPLMRVLVNNSHYDEWFSKFHYDHVAGFIVALRNNEQFQAFIGGWVFPVFVALVLVFWLLEEDKSKISMQFLLLPLAYIPFSILGFTLVHADFEVSYLYVNTLIILTFGYIYILFWGGIMMLFQKLGLSE